MSMEMGIWRTRGPGEWTTYRTSLANNRGVEKRPGNSEEMEESKGWRCVQAPEVAPFVLLYRVGGYRLEG